jgi:GNAT superfamily N-acetyltransferase
MLRFRRFRNTDPPLVAELWRSREQQLGLLQPISADGFEQFVFGKLHFDYSGLILAFEDDRPVGFAHASFGPASSRKGISTETGVVCLVLVRPDCHVTDVAQGLLAQCEAYLRSRGAKTIFGGAICPNNPFYLGLYGGCELPGILDSDTVARQSFVAQGYAEVRRTLVFRRNLTTFRPVVDRQQMQCRRRMLVQTRVDPPAKDWWEACTTGDFDLTRFELLVRGATSPIAHVTVREMACDKGISHGRAAGILNLFVDRESRRQGCACYLLSEAFQAMAAQGIAIVEAQTTDDNAAGNAVFRKLGFEEVAEGAVYQSPPSPA